MTFAVVCVGYNRPDGMERLLRSVEAADFDSDAVTLVISLDKGQRQDELIALAEGFTWTHGDKVVRAFPERQGLRPHILSCGALTETYDAVIILEDDLAVSPQFYRYAKAAAAFYADEERIGGISLYKHLLQVDKCRPFTPAEDGHFAYLMQFAQSWGQCWTRAMWQKFSAWYGENEGKPITGDSLPNCVIRWNEHSWMKYYMKYLVETDRYFVYPQTALTTCYADVGQHGGGCNDYQVPLLTGATPFTFPAFEEAVKYDIFFERQGLTFPFAEGKKVCVDLYGSKKDFSGYDLLASTASRPYRVVDRFVLRYRPQENNLTDPCEGDDVLIYDLSAPAEPPKRKASALVNYDVRTVNWKRLLAYGREGFRAAVKRRFSRKKK